MCLLKKQFCAVYLLLFLSLNSVLIVFCSESHLKYDEECCALELEEIPIQDGKKFIPSNAVLARDGSDGMKEYFFVSNDSYRIGLIDNSVDPSNCIVARISGSVYCSRGKILTNPNNCVYDWKDMASTRRPQETNQFAYPMIEQHGRRYSSSSSMTQFYFVKSGDKIGAMDAETTNNFLFKVFYSTSFKF